MQFAVAVLALATAVMAGPRVDSYCGNNYGQELCLDWATNQNNAIVGVCNDKQVWARRQQCGGRNCCVDKPEGGAYCKC